MIPSGKPFAQAIRIWQAHEAWKRQGGPNQLYHVDGVCMPSRIFGDRALSSRIQDCIPRKREFGVTYKLAQDEEECLRIAGGRPIPI